MSADKGSETDKSDPLDKIAELLHVGWRQWMEVDGYVYGPSRWQGGPPPKTHPHIFAWSRKEPHEKNQDRFQAALILHEWARGGIRSETDLARAIHQTWGAWMYIRGNPNKKNEHLAVYEKVHGVVGERKDHIFQASLVFAYLRGVTLYEQPSDWDLVLHQERPKGF